MVLKEYECPIHGKFEHWIGMNEELKECPQCNAEVKRVYQATTSIWKTDGACGKIYGCP